MKNKTEKAVMDIILSMFTKKIKYDYTIPETYIVRKLVKESLDNKILSVPTKSMIRYISETIMSDYSLIEEYLLFNPKAFGNEFFTGHGTLYRWRNGERKKAIQNAEKQLTKKTISEIKKAITPLVKTRGGYGSTKHGRSKPTTE